MNAAGLDARLLRRDHDVLTIDDLPRATLTRELAPDNKAETIVSHTNDELIEEPQVRTLSPAGAPRYSRRLSDKILIAFHQACDQGDLEVAEQLLHVLEMMVSRRPLNPDGSRRKNMESLVAAHERLWHLRHPILERA